MIQKSLFGLLLVLSSISTLTADDWDQWMGPNRDNVWNESGIIDKFPEGGPKVLWKADVAIGYSGPAVAAGKVFVTDFMTDENVKIANFERRQFTGTERVQCMDESTGKQIWEYKYPVTYAISYPSGPRCTPVVDDDRVYCLGAQGNLVCLDVKSGKPVWEVDLAAKYNTKPALWGYAAHPLIDGDQLITLAGGENTHVVSFDKMTGDVKWSSQTAPEQGYSPPTIIEQAGVRQLILAQPDAIESVNPADGSKYWSVPYEATSGSIIMAPLHVGNYLYIAGYNRQAMLIKLDPDKPTAEVEWQNSKRAISPVNVQPYLDAKNKIVYGMDQSGDMVALKLPEGERLWADSTPVSQRRVGNGTAFIVRQGDRFWLFNENGELVIAKMDASGYQEIDRAKIVEPTNNAFGRPVVWSMPAFANRKGFLRNDKELVCVDLAKE